MVLSQHDKIKELMKWPIFGDGVPNEDVTPEIKREEVDKRWD